MRWLPSASGSNIKQQDPKYSFFHCYVLFRLPKLPTALFFLLELYHTKYYMMAFCSIISGKIRLVYNKTISVLIGLTMPCLGMEFSGFIFSEVYSVCWIYLPLTKFRTFSVISSSNKNVQPHIFFLSFWDSSDANVRFSVLAPEISEIQICFLSVCSVLFRLDDFY